VSHDRTTDRTDPTLPPGTSGPSSTPASELTNELTSAVFELLRLVMGHRERHINDLFATIHLRHGDAGLGRFLSGVAAAVLCMTDIGDRTAYIRPRLDTDRASLAQYLFRRDTDGDGPVQFAPEMLTVLSAGLRLVCDVADLPPQSVAANQRQVLDAGMAVLTAVITGLVLVVRATLDAMTTAQRLRLLTYQPLATGVHIAVRDTIAAAWPEQTRANRSSGQPGDPGARSSFEPSFGPSFELPPGMGEAILKAIVSGDEQQAARQFETLIGPMMMLHGEPAVFAVLGMLASQIAELLGSDLVKAVQGGGPLMAVFADRTGRVISPDDVDDGFGRCLMLGFQFLNAHVNNDEQAQRGLIQAAEHNAGLLITALATVYRQTYLQRQEIRR